MYKGRPTASCFSMKLGRMTSMKSHCILANTLNHSVAAGPAEAMVPCLSRVFTTRLHHQTHTVGSNKI